MKKVSFTLLCLWQSIICLAQITDELGNIHILKSDNSVETILKRNDVYIGDKFEPEFPGGDAKMKVHIQKEGKYVGSKALEAIVRFLVEDDGEIRIPFILKSSGNEVFDREMIRVVQNMPEWTPVSIDGNNVRAYKSIIVNYDPNAIIPGTVGTGIVYETIDETIKGNSKATFTGGQNTMFRWLSQNIKYPAICRETNKQGTVLVVFIIEKDGSLSTPKVKQSSGNELLDSEALRVILNMPRWNPAMINEKPVRCNYELPTTFKLEG